MAFFFLVNYGDGGNVGPNKLGSNAAPLKNSFSSFMHTPPYDACTYHNY